MTAQWQLFIDESGQFSRTEDTVVVAGFLVQVEQNPRFQGLLRELLDSVFPGVKYPPHATDLNQEKDIRLQQARDRALFELCKAMGERLVAFAVGAGEACESRDEPSTLSPAEAGLRYRSLVVAMLERVVALMREKKAPAHQVWVHLLAPSFHAPAGGASFHYSRAMMIEDLRRASSLPKRTADSAHGPESVFLAGHPPYEWNTQTPPGLVLADFIANRLRRVLRRQPGLLSAESQFLQRMAFPLSAGARGWSQQILPSLASTGEPQAVLRKAFEQSPPPPPWLPDTSPRWAREQGMKWLSVL